MIEFIDTYVNKLLKHILREIQADWIANRPQDFTKQATCRRESYEMVCFMKCLKYGRWHQIKTGCPWFLVVCAH